MEGIPPLETQAAPMRQRRQAWLAEGNAVLDARQWWWRDATTGKWSSSALLPESDVALRGPEALRDWLRRGLAEAAWPEEAPASADVAAVAVRGFVYSHRLKADLVVTLAGDADDTEIVGALVNGNGQVRPQESLDGEALSPLWRDAMLRTAAVWLELDPQENAERAVELGRSAYEADPAEHRGAMAYAELLLRAGRVFDAMHVWQSVHAAHPYLSAPLIRLADTLIRLGAESEDQQLLAMADAATSQAAYRFPDELAAQVVRARFYYTVSQPKRARSLLQEVLAGDDEGAQAGEAYYEAHHLLGLIALDQQELATAQTHFTHCLAQRPEDADAHRNKARLHLALEEPDEARKHLEAAEQLAAGDPRIAQLRKQLEPHGHRDS